MEVIFSLQVDFLLFAGDNILQANEKKKEFAKTIRYFTLFAYQRAVDDVQVIGDGVARPRDGATQARELAHAHNATDVLRRKILLFLQSFSFSYPSNFSL